MMLQAADVPVSPDLLAIGVPVGMAVVVAVLLLLMRPPVTKGVMVAFAPWMVTGAAVHALYTVDAYPDWADPLFDPVAVYFTTFTAAGMMWAYMNAASRIGGDEFYDAQYLAASGVGAALVTAGFVLSKGHGTPISRVLPAFGGLVVALVVASVAYVAVAYVYSETVIHTGVLGWLAVFGHTLDGVMTAVAHDVFGYAPLYEVGRRVVRYADTLPTAEVVGRGWLLVAVKLVAALVVVAVVASLLDRTTDERRRVPGYLLLAGVAAYGLGPGVHHLLTLVLLG